MKIMIVSTHSPSDDAIGEYTAKIATELSKKENIIVLANKAQNSTNKLKVAENGEEKNYTVLRIWNTGFLYPFTIFRGIVQNKPDIVHFQHEYFLYGKGFKSLFFPLILILTRFTKIPQIITMHHVIPKEKAGFFRDFFKAPIPIIIVKLFLIIFNKLLTSTNKIIVPSNQFKLTLSRDYRIARSKIEIIPHLICLKPTFEKINFDENHIFKAKTRLHLNGKKVVLFFGYIRPTKGIEYIICALPSIIKKFPDLVFVIVGRAKQSYHDYFDYIHQLVKELKLSLYVRFENYVSNALLQYYFIASDLVVFPYVTTVGTTPIAYIKAVEFGKPIIATDIKPFSEIFVDHENSLLVPPRDSHALSDSIIELLSNEMLSREISSNVTKNFSQNCRKKSIEKILKIYHDVIQHKKNYWSAFQ